MISLEPKTKKLLKLLGKVFLALIAVGLLAWFLLISPYLTRQEKQRFESAAVQLEKIATDIQGLVGQAVSIEKKQSCDRPNLKFEKGPLSCSSGVEFSYVAADFSEANTVVEKAARLNDSAIRPGPFADGKSFISTKTRPKQILYQDLDAINSLNCAISYRLAANESTNVLLLISLSCADGARAEHYPLAD